MHMYASSLFIVQCDAFFGACSLGRLRAERTHDLDFLDFFLFVPLYSALTHFNTLMSKKNLQEKVQRLSNELEELRLEREESKKNVMHFIQEADVARQELEKAQATIAHLTQQLNGGLATPPPTDKLARLLAKVHSLDDTDPLMDKLLDVLEGGNDDKIQHYQQQLHTAQRDYDQQKQQLHQAQEHISQLEHEKQQINDILAAANRDKTQLEERVTRLEEDQKHMADALDTANTEKMMAQSALERVQEERQRMDDALSATNTAKTTAQQAVARLEAEIKHMTETLAIVNADKTKLQDQLSTIQNDYATEHDRAETLEQRWQSSEGELEQAEARINRLEQEITTLRQQQWEAKVPAATQKAEWERKIHDLQSKYDQAQQQCNQSKADLAAMTTDLIAWKEKHQQLSEAMVKA